MSPTTKARIQVIVYTILAISLNYLLGSWIWHTHSTTLVIIVRQNYALVSMWLPGILALLMMKVWRVDLHSSGWKLSNLRYVLEAYTIPLLLASFIALFALFMNDVAWREIQIMPMLWEDIHGWFVINTSVTNVGDAFPLRILVAGTLGILPFFIHAFGEEIGWRGYLLSQLELSKWRYPIFIQALIWSQWHLPILQRVPTQSDVEFIGWVVQFTVGLTLLGMWIGYLYQRSRSIWVITLAHASHNLFFTVWGVSLTDNGRWLTEYSIPVIIGYLCVIFWITRQS